MDLSENGVYPQKVLLMGKMMIIHSYHGGSLTWHTDHFDGFPCVALCEINAFFVVFC